MGYYIRANNGHIGTNIKEYVIDTVSDLNTLPTDTRQVGPGSAAICVENSAVYMLNTKGEWKEI